MLGQSIPRPEVLETKRSKISTGGLEQLQVIFDFDHTLTPFRLQDGRSTPMCHDTIEKSEKMPKEFKQAYDDLWADQFKGLEAGDWDWEEWWARSQGLMKDFKLQKDWLPEMITEAGVVCRGRCRELFELLERLRIPVMIVSAGITDIIREVMRREGIDLSNVQLMGNQMAFGEDGLLAGWSQPTITSFSKAGVGTWQKDYFAAVARKNVLLVGDSIRDVDCLTHLDGLDEDLRVGLFDIPKRVPDQAKYEAAFDLLLSSEPSPAGDQLDLSPIIDLILQLANLNGSPSKALPHPEEAEE